MPLTIGPPPTGVAADSLHPFERVVREVLGDIEEPLDVRFGVCPGGDGRVQYVCKVEGPPSAAFALEEQWRWWSPIVSEPDELRASLREAMARRQRRTSLAPGRSGWVPAPPVR